MLRCGSTLFGLNPPVLGRRGQDCTCAISLLLAFPLQYIICTMMYYWYQIVRGKVVVWILLLQGGNGNSLPYFSGSVHFVHRLLQPACWLVGYMCILIYVHIICMNMYIYIFVLQGGILNSRPFYFTWQFIPS